MSLMILSCMYVLCRQAYLVKKKHFLGIIILIFFAWALSHYRETDRLLCDIEISGKIQNYFLKSDSILLNFALQIQHSWALGLILLR